MSKQREALIVAARFIDGFIKSNPLSQMDIGTNQVFISIQEALAEPEQEPVAWIYQNANTSDEYLVWKCSNGGRNWRPLYLSSPIRKPLTEPELHAIEPTWPIDWNYDDMLAFVRAIERAHGIGEP